MLRMIMSQKSLALLVAGVLEKIYSHLLSLDNFRRLLNRRSFFAVSPPTKPRDLN